MYPLEGSRGTGPLTCNPVDAAPPPVKAFNNSISMQLRLAVQPLTQPVAVTPPQNSQ